MDDDPCSATTAYLAVSGSLDDASATLLACQLALHQALDSARAAVYADALDLELGRDAAAAAAAAARFEAIASDPATEFVWDLAGECAAGLARFADSASGGRSGTRNAFKSPLPALLAEARGAQADRAPCPAAALEMLRGGDAAVAVNAVADAAAEAAGAFARMGLGGGWRRCAREVLRGGSRGGGVVEGGGGALERRRGRRGRGRGEAVPDGYVLAPLRASQALQAEVRSRRRRRGRVAVDRGGGARTDVDRRQLVALERALFNAG